ncbi:MAG: glycosyltransferase family 4 protein [Dysgonamonadaceae bacterium]|jgi:glycosyltransferase involved in cell wall biosynthesis|nr:glycosyltransferase family 4 protein [Dysgonamonadaceae bacterium]MDD3309041.1 glycosyltransferase family 4 protein [Dysgonamonadaceae bacterium]MDD3900953.1 glycosyltransferase family 4 protein [Dysgonamonadaceae bacterium]MDD4399374.1 glycosyltransferase family 4 protein [Dysgonamonadaceae bacterium]MEA5082166.1 glycosyltransferase family 4 protein [Dysgonamonadaceae bacterium]
MERQEQLFQLDKSIKTMRILWIINDVLPDFHPFVVGTPTTSGSWIAPLFYALKNQSELTMGSVTPILDGMEQKINIDNISYYAIRINEKENISNMNKSLAEKYLSVINDFKPDIIHIHGTEHNFGLLRKYVSPRIPIVCSIQSIIVPYRDYMKKSAATLKLSKYRSVKNRLGRGGINNALRRWNKYSSVEKEIFKINKYFIGRTSWDKNQLQILNPNTLYFHGEELLRSPFYDTQWDLNQCERHRIFVSSALHPIKGFHILLKAVAFLKDDFPDIKIVAPLPSINMKSSKIKDWMIGEDYSNFLKRLIIKYDLEDNIIMRDSLSAYEMAKEFRKAHLFVLPSLIENSPNSLGESMLVGTPAVVSIMGGITSIVSDNESALLFPSGDSYSLAFQIGRLFSNDILALKLSKNARQIALRRHDVKQTSEQYCHIYEDIIKQHNESIRNIP